jgi:4-amino-4-deoxy-L-arabinose transferase-like glycosyltransferase
MRINARAHRVRSRYTSDNIVYLLLMMILVFGIILAITLYAGPNMFYDDVWYINSAHLLATGNSSFILSKFSFAFLKTAILALSFKVLGYGGVQAVLPNFAYFIITVYLVFLIGKYVAGRALGLIAAFIATTTPFFVAHATRVNPDVALGMALALILYLFFKYARMPEAKRHTNRFMPFAIGLATSFAVYLKTEGFLIVFTVALFVFILYLYLRANARRIPAWRHTVDNRFMLYAIIGLVIGFGVYFSVFYALSGNPFFSLENYGGAAAPTGISKIATIITLLDPYTPYLSAASLNPDVVPLGLLPIFALIGTVIGTRKRNMNITFLSLITWFVFVYLFFGPASTTRFITVPTVTRLFSLLIAPLSVLAGYFIIEVYKMRYKTIKNAAVMRGVIPAFLVLFLIVTSIPIYIGYHAYAQSITETRGLLINTNAELVHLAGGANLTAYINTSIGSRLTTFYNMQFLSNYSTHEHFFNTQGLAPMVNVVDTCPDVLPNAHTYLIALLPNTIANESSNPGSVINRWTGNNCTLTLLWNYSEKTDYYGYMVPLTVRVYGVTETR